jgi:haloalkane dehalogenase
MSDAAPTTETASWRKLYPFASHFVATDGVRQHYLDEGEGPAVVMVHGNPTWSFYYREAALALRHEHRIIVPDHVGCGLSDKPQDYSYRLAQHIDNLEFLINDHLQLSEVDLMVHDWGGAIGMGYAVRNPDRVRRLVVLNTAAFLMDFCPFRIRVCRWPLFGSLALRGFNAFARAATTMAVRKPLAPEVKEGLLAPYDSWENRIATLRFVQDIPLRRSHPSWETVADIQKHLHLLADKPMLICWGMQDFCFTEAFLDIWQSYFPNARVHRFEDAGHYVLEDAGDRVIPLAERFLLPAMS